MGLAFVVEFRLMRPGEGVSQVVDTETGAVPPDEGSTVGTVKKDGDLPFPGAIAVSLGKIPHVVAQVRELVVIRHDAPELEGKSLRPADFQMVHHTAGIDKMVFCTHFYFLSSALPLVLPQVLPIDVYRSAKAQTFLSFCCPWTRVCGRAYLFLPEKHVVLLI